MTGRSPLTVTNRISPHTCGSVSNATEWDPGTVEFDRIDVRPDGDGDGVRLTYDATVTFNGKAKLADPLMTLVFLKLARETVRDLTRPLEALPRR